jgi:hypothetical protein
MPLFDIPDRVRAPWLWPLAVIDSTLCRRKRVIRSVESVDEGGIANSKGGRGRSAPPVGVSQAGGTGRGLQFIACGVSVCQPLADFYRYAAAFIGDEVPDSPTASAGEQAQFAVAYPVA